MKKEVEIRFLEDCLLIDKEILVFGDVHIGYEEHIAERGAIPDVQFKEIIERLDRVFKLLKKDGILIKQIIILGDLKHEFGGISDKEWSETLRLIDYLDKKIEKDDMNKQKKDKIILIKGNHDNILGPIAKKRDLKVVDYYKVKGICFMHGNKLYNGCFEDCKYFILGHLHPSISLVDKYKKEKFKCFLKGKWKNKEVYVLPSFSPISFGYDLNSFRYEKEQDNGFFIVPEKDLKKFEVIIYNNLENRNYNFGKLSKIIEKMN
ncbi:metallophosphoesterase [Candidatus Pacearchaeota archaeon]|nr:metallophosphoesterase [Candidatus Pacearchaeota archaeon]